MIYLPEETFQRNAVLASTYNKGNKAGEYRSRDQKRRGILKWREIVHLHVFFHLFQERLNTSLQFFGMKGCIVFRIGIPWGW